MHINFFTVSDTPAGNCTTGEVRLTDSTEDTILSTMNGRLEICINNAWGAVCNDDLFGVSDARVACQQVGGYEREIVGDIDSVSIMGPVFLSEIGCDGNEDSLLECRSYSSIGDECDVEEAPVITCRGQLLLYNN